MAHEHTHDIKPASVRATGVPGCGDCCHPVGSATVAPDAQAGKAFVGVLVEDRFLERVKGLVAPQGTGKLAGMFVQVSEEFVALELPDTMVECLSKR